MLHFLPKRREKECSKCVYRERPHNTMEDDRPLTHIAEKTHPKEDEVKTVYRLVHCMIGQGRFKGWDTKFELLFYSNLKMY